jgi:hypothetical protein
MRLSVTIHLLTLVGFASAAPLISQRQGAGPVKVLSPVSDLANELNQDIIPSTQFSEALPTLSTSALSIRANVACEAILNGTNLINFIANVSSNNTMVQTIKFELVDSDFLLNLSRFARFCIFQNPWTSLFRRYS